MKLTYIRNGGTLRLDPARCRGCGRCIEVCPHDVLALSDGKSTVVNRSCCMECGACMMNCERGAISVRAGVGCASAVISGMLRGTPAQCGCGERDDASGSGCCCG